MDKGYIAFIKTYVNRGMTRSIFWFSVMQCESQMEQLITVYVLFCDCRKSNE